MKKLTNQQFIDKANLVHKNKYNYSKTDYINATTKVLISCLEHGSFLQTPHNHLRNRGCPKCGIELIKTKKRSARDKFITKANNIHNYEYDYSQINYKNGRTKVIIVCSTHGVFSQSPENHLSGKSCPKCANIDRGLKLKLKTKDFVKRAENIHNKKIRLF